MITFWSPRGRGIGPHVLSQWYPSPFTVQGTSYPTAEHWMMAEKARLFADEDALKRILAAPTSKVAQALGRTVRGFGHAQWAAACRGIVTAGNRHKFQQSPALGAYLRSTRDAILVEASPYDRIWGCWLRASDPRIQDPAQWPGQNLLGRCLMTVRAEML